MSDTKHEAGLFWRFDEGASIRLAASIVGVGPGALDMAFFRGGDAYLAAKKLRSSKQQEAVEQRLSTLIALLPRTEFH